MKLFVYIAGLFPASFNRLRIFRPVIDSEVAPYLLVDFRFLSLAPILFPPVIDDRLLTPRQAPMVFGGGLSPG
ncbi:hypothetical protein F2Q69_00057422 [Brassica cretica]|uniref:Uncharacterized protein n=1 Tax=Brassica cretica TaxID=69181 RepID=A0A8S9MUJ4_BRACR|nr:hypothetical protein F2Q69_00057422 [Brassica cretica]